LDWGGRHCQSLIVGLSRGDRRSRSSVDGLDRGDRVLNHQSLAHATFEWFGLL